MIQTDADYSERNGGFDSNILSTLLFRKSVDVNKCMLHSTGILNIFNLCLVEITADLLLLLVPQQEGWKT
jgi:hypothetical protein